MPRSSRRRRASGVVLGRAHGVSWYRVFNDGILPQACEPQPGYEPLVVALGRLAIDEQGKALLEAERCNVRLPPLLRRSGTATSARVTDHGRPECMVEGLGKAPAGELGSLRMRPGGWQNPARAAGT